MGAILAAVGSVFVPLWIWMAGPESFEFGGEYLSPIHDNRQIHTVSGNFWWGRGYFGQSFEVLSGFVITRPWGEIEQLNSNLEEVTLASSAWGAGPSFVFRWNLFSESWLKPFLDASGGTVFYDRPFPGGGENYNFMGRFGGGLAFGSIKSFSLILKYQWMHVSNGQGLVPNNPSYEARGPYIALRFAF